MSDWKSLIGLKITTPEYTEALYNAFIERMETENLIERKESKVDTSIRQEDERNTQDVPQAKKSRKKRVSRTNKD